MADLKVAQLPWDPPPVPSQTQHISSGPANIVKHQPQTVPSNGNPILAQPSTNNPQRASDGTRIKPEPGSYPSPISQQNGYTVPPVPQFHASYKMNAQQHAQQRAAMNLQQSFGPQAAQQISQLQQQASQQRSQGVPSAPYLKMEDQKPLLSSHPPFSPTASQSPNPPVSSAQTDGARDSLAGWKAEVARRRELIAQNPGEGDRLFRQHWLETQQRLEGGGLMLPLSEQRTTSKGIKRKIQNIENSKVSTSDVDPQQPINESEPSLFRAQGDATADDYADGEVDEDAINSDLDDSDQQEEDENNEENTDQIMLCTYDKVQRVKNKWKCTLKDGIVKVGSTE